MLNTRVSVGEIVKKFKKIFKKVLTYKIYSGKLRLLSN